MRNDVITLTVPALGEYAKTVRMTAAELASRLGMSYDEVDDVRMAAEEAFVYAADCTEETGDITFVFAVRDSELEITVGPLPCSTETCTGASEGYAEFILRSVCDDFSIEHDDADGCLLHLLKRGTAAAGDAGD